MPACLTGANRLPEHLASTTMNILNKSKFFVRVWFLAVLGWAAIANNTWALGWFGSDITGKNCTGSAQGFGPYDYFDINDESDAKYVEGRYWEIDKIHTDQAVPILSKRGRITQGDLQYAGNQLDYTLRAIPNDPKALKLMVDYDRMRRSNPTLVSPIPLPECYFQRALEFRADQEHISLIFGVYLHQIKQYTTAIAQFKRAIALNDKATEAYYNLALSLIASGDIKGAVPYAKKAYELGFPLPGLREKLRRKGVWDDAAKSG